ncbi:MAG: site-specific integrase [Verrucomicrobia bacterium]|nr:site-specific integrase [Verrucomicrobiota bacterium]
MACVWKHDSLNTPYWVARFTNHEGKRVNRSTKMTNRQKAQALADRWEAAAKLAGRRELVQAAAVRVLDEMMVATIGEEMKRDSIGDYFLKWMNEPGKHGKRSDATLKAYTTQISGFLAHLGEERSKASITSLTAAEIEAWRNAELRSGKSAKTTNTAVATLRAALEKAVRQGVILHNPAKAVDPIDVWRSTHRCRRHDLGWGGLRQSNTFLHSKEDAEDRAEAACHRHAPATRRGSECTACRYWQGTDLPDTPRAFQRIGRRVVERVCGTDEKGRGSGCPWKRQNWQGSGCQLEVIPQPAAFLRERPCCS